MTPSLLTEIETAGIVLSRNGDRLHYQTRPGVSLDPFREQIVANKPALLRELLQRELMAAASVEPGQFDRDAYDRLGMQWRALPDPEAEAAALIPQLEAGWQWMDSHPDHPEHGRFLIRWLPKLVAYEQTFAHAPGDHRGPVDASVPPVKWSGVLPTGCGVPHACAALGPCPAFTEHGCCWKERRTR